MQYIVEVSRLSVRSKTFSVDADSEDAAAEEALLLACNHNYSTSMESSSEYTVESIRPA